MSTFENLEIVPCENIDYTDSRLKKLNLDSDQKAKMDLFVSQIPTLLASDTLSNAYTVKFPDGVVGTLMKYKDGGVGSPILGETGTVAHASFHKIDSYSVMFNAFSVMSIATGQYFLKEISNDFQIISDKIDQIMDFLQGEKKSELIAEISFVKNAYSNFSSIMNHNEQRIATIISLQAAQKIAIKDIEFYLNSLHNKTEQQHKSYASFSKTASEAIQDKKYLDLAVQLYAISNIMEVHFAQNTDENYLQNLKDNMIQYINKCERRVLGDFSSLSSQNNRFKSSPVSKIDTTFLRDEFGKIINPLNEGEKSHMHMIIDAAIGSLSKASEYRITKSGDVYVMYA